MKQLCICLVNGKTVKFTSVLPFILFIYLFPETEDLERTCSIFTLYLFISHVREQRTGTDIPIQSKSPPWKTHSPYAEDFLSPIIICKD